MELDKGLRSNGYEWIDSDADPISLFECHIHIMQQYYNDPTTRLAKSFHSYLCFSLRAYALFVLLHTIHSTEPSTSQANSLISIQPSSLRRLLELHVFGMLFINQKEPDFSFAKFNSSIMTSCKSYTKRAKKPRCLPSLGTCLPG